MKMDVTVRPKFDIEISNKSIGIKMNRFQTGDRVAALRCCFYSIESPEECVRSLATWAHQVVIIMRKRLLKKVLLIFWVNYMNDSRDQSPTIVDHFFYRIESDANHVFKSLVIGLFFFVRLYFVRVFCSFVCDVREEKLFC